MSSLEFQPVTFLGDFSKKFAANTLFNLMGRCLSFAITLLLTPFILAHLSIEDFGAWVLFSIFMTSFNLLDFGLGSSFVKYISEYHASEDYARMNRVLFSGLVFYVAFGLFVILAGLAIEQPLFHFFNILAPPQVYHLILVSCALSNIAMMFLSVFKGIQRMDKSSSIEILLTLINAVGTLIFLSAGWGMYGLAVNAFIGSIIALFLTCLTVLRVMPRLSLGSRYDGRLLRDMFAYGAKIQVSRLGGLICFHVDKLIISLVLGTASVSFYEVSSRLASFMRAAPLVMISTLIPVTSALDARNDREKILQTYSLASKYVAIVAAAVVAFLVIEAQSIITLWLGAGFENSVILVQVLAVGYGVNVLGGAASQTGAGVGRPEFDMRSTILLSVLNPVLSVVLIHRYGIAGAAAGTSLALIASASYLLFIFHRNYVKNSAWTIIRAVCVRPVVAGILASAAVLGFHEVFPQIAALAAERRLTPIKILADLSVFGPVYVALLVSLRQVTAIDWKNFTGLISFAYEFVRHPQREHVKIYR